MLNKEQVVVIFFDVEKAYDRTWRYGIVKDLFDAGLRGLLPMFISEFIINRTFNLKLKDIFSRKKELEMGLPQGSILSVSLFCLKINSIIKHMPPEILNCMYIDDCIIAYKNKSIDSIGIELNKTLQTIENWALNNGVIFSSTKTEAILFTNKRKNIYPKLTFKNNLIKYSKTYMFLGLIFDEKLNFIPHVNYLKRKCIKTMNIIKVLSNYKWGANEDKLLDIYRAKIRSKLDYGCQIYGAARPTYLKTLNSVSNEALRRCLGAYRTSPSTSLHVLAYEQPRHIGNIKLSLNYYVKNKSNPYNSAF